MLLNEMPSKARDDLVFEGFGPAGPLRRGRLAVVAGAEDGYGVADGYRGIGA